MPQPKVKMRVRGIGAAAAQIVAAVVGIVVAMAPVVGVGGAGGIVGVIVGFLLLLLLLLLLAPGYLRLRRPRVPVVRLLEGRQAFRRRRRSLLPLSYIHLLLRG